jgi:hypothetical protein
MASYLKTSRVKLVNSLSKIPEKEKNLCLVVEVPKVGFEGSYRRASNPNLSMNFEWWQYVSDLHMVMPNLHQLYIFCTLEWKHYHCDKDKLISEVKKSQLDVKVHIYPPNKNVLESEFVKVINVDFDTFIMELMSLIPWKKIASSVHHDTVVVPMENQRIRKKAPPGSNNPTLKRQQFYKDAGYTSGQCLIGTDPLGVSLPALKPSTNEFHIKAIVALTALLRHHIFQDLRETVYFGAVNTTRCQDFAQKLHPDNVLESLHAALSNLLNPCGCHDDTHNDKHQNFGPVITFSIFLTIDGVVYRLPIIGCSRKSIQEYYERRQQPDALLIQDIHTVIEELPASRTDWLASIKMINGCYDMNLLPRIGSTDQGFYADYCHMNIFHYLSTWIHYASQLVTQFSLSYEGTVGLVVGMYVNNNAIDFVVVAKDLMEEEDSIVTVTSSELGLIVRRLMFQKKSELKKSL